MSNIHVLPGYIKILNEFIKKKDSIHCIYVIKKFNELLKASSFYSHVLIVISTYTACFFV